MPFSTAPLFYYNALEGFATRALFKFIQLSDSYIKDSQNLIQKLDIIKFPAKIKISSLDFESLYSNINLADALHIITDFMKDKISNNHFTVLGIHRILKLVLEITYSSSMENIIDR